MLSEADLIKECKKHCSAAQRELYRRYASKMRGICLRYTNDSEEAKDVLQEGFIKVFSSIHKYSGAGSFEGWIKRIIINTAITNFNKNKKNLTLDISDVEDECFEERDDENEAMGLIKDAELSQEEILDSLKILSDAYRMVFNMFYIEGYSHKEIAEMLMIDEKTSRSRLFRARQNLQKYLYKICADKVKATSKLLHGNAG